MTRFHELGSGMMMIEFEDKLDKERVLRDSPWNFEKCLINCKNTMEHNKSKNYHLRGIFLG